MEGSSDDEFKTPPRTRLRKCYSVPITTDMPCDVIESYSNEVIRMEGTGNLEGKSPSLSQRKLVPTHRYDGKEWIDCDVASEMSISDHNPSLGSPTEIYNLSFYTQNIWFGKQNKEERFKNIIQMMKESNADFICLQEVEKTFFEKLVQDENIRSKYYFSGNSITDYGLLMLSKWPCFFYDFPYANTWMDRSFLVAETVFNGESFYACTTHLESMDNPKKRAEQMDYIQHTILKDKDAVFMGDLNFDFSWHDEGKNLDKTLFTDLWADLRSKNEEAFTKDGTTKYKPVVLDHVLLSNSSQFKGEFIQRVGNYCCRNFGTDLVNEIREDDVVRTPSDHLGLYSVISLK